MNKETDMTMKLNPYFKDTLETSNVVWSHDENSYQFNFDFTDYLCKNPVELMNSHPRILLEFLNDECSDKQIYPLIIDSERLGQAHFIIPDKILGYVGDVKASLTIDFDDKSHDLGSFYFRMKKSPIDDKMPELQFWVDEFDQAFELFKHGLDEFNEDIKESNAKVDEIKDLIVKNDVLKKVEAESFKENFIGNLSVAKNIGEDEINPDSLVKKGEVLSDFDILQRAITYVENSSRRLAIRLGRAYEITNTLHVSGHNPQIIIRGAGGRLINKHDGFMFSGTNGKNTGGLYFQNVFFEGLDGFEHPLFEFGGYGKIVLVTFSGCQFYRCPTIAFSESYIQSIRFLDCNMQRQRTYAIKAKYAYDVTADNHIFEDAVGGFLWLEGDENTGNYATYSLRITNGLWEGILNESIFKLGAVGSATFNDNYFEGNYEIDIDLSLSTKMSHKSLSITNNFFGNYDINKKKSNVKIGLLSSSLAYDFSCNLGIRNPIFDFSGNTYGTYDVFGTHCLLSNDAFVGLKEQNLISGKNYRKQALVTNKYVQIPIKKITIRELLKEKISISVNWNINASAVYVHSLDGYLFFRTGYKDGNKIQVILKKINAYSNRYFNDDDSTDFKVKFKSSDSEFITLNSLDVAFDETIIIENTNPDVKNVDSAQYSFESKILGYE